MGTNLKKIKAPGYWHKSANEVAETIANDLSDGFVKSKVAGCSVITDSRLPIASLCAMFNASYETVGQWDINYFYEEN